MTGAEMIVMLGRLEKGVARAREAIEVFKGESDVSKARRSLTNIRSALSSALKSTDRLLETGEKE